MTKPMTDSELAGWRDTLTDLERRLTIAEHDVRTGIGTPDGLGYTMAQKGYFKGRLDALTKARDGLLRPIAREQERRLSRPDAPDSPQNGPQDAEQAAHEGNDVAPDGAPVEREITRRQVEEGEAA